VFGARLAAMIARWPDVVLVLAARRREPLEALRDRLEGPATIEIMTLDRNAPEDLATRFAVVDAAGPFQTSDLRLAKAALAAGAHYVDLADGRAFVEAVPGRDSPGGRHGREPLGDHRRQLDPGPEHGGAGSPDRRLEPHRRGDHRHLARRRRPARTVGHRRRSSRGPASRCACSKAGPGPNATGLERLTRVLFPGLGRRWVALAETPDLDLMPRRYKPRYVGRFEAGLELPMAHHGLALLGWARRAGLVRDLARSRNRWASWPTAGAVRDRSWRDGRRGRRQGRTPTIVRARWGLWAEAGAGPNTPASPAAAILRALLDDRLPGPPRATPCVGLLPLEDLLAPLTPFPIRTRIDMASPRANGVFARALGPRLAALPEVVRQAHDGSARTLTGWARGRGAGGPARLVRRLQGLPERGRHETTVVDRARSSWAKPGPASLAHVASARASSGSATTPTPTPSRRRPAR
jgi:hypothetical protein